MHRSTFSRVTLALAAVVLVSVSTAASAQDRSRPPPTSRTSPGVARRVPGADARPPGPPREALEACRAQRSGATCAFAGRDGARLTGRCVSPPGAPLACLPDRPPPPPPEAVEACVDIAIDDACIVETPRGVIEGVCRELREGPAVCIPRGAPPPPRPAAP